MECSTTSLGMGETMDNLPVKQSDTPTLPTHQPNGKFAKGNKFGGDPLIAKLQSFRKVVLNSVTQRELREVMKALVRKAVDGDVNAAKLILERTCGKLDPNTQVNVTNVNPNSVTICIKQEDDDNLK